MHIAILDAITPQELDNPALINGAARERIASESKQPIDDVARMMVYFKQTQILHMWLQMK